MLTLCFSLVFKVTCAVGPRVLQFIAKPIAKGIEARTESKPVGVIACENAINATNTLAEHIKKQGVDAATIDKRAVFANCAIDRIVPGQDADAGLNVKIESFFEWVVERKPFGSEHPPVHAIHWVDELEPYIERKLFTVNTGHATAAYWGHHLGKHTIDEALADKTIHEHVQRALEETSHLIEGKHGIGKHEQKQYRDKIVTRISNPYLKDVVERVGRAPLRKLSRKERFIGPAAELAEQGDKVDALLGGVEMAFRFTNVEGDDESKELAEILRDNDAKAVVEKVCGLTEKDKLFPQVVAIVEKVKTGSS